MEYNNFKKEDAGCNIYGKQRLELAIFLRDNILGKLNKKWFIENGTLLGAFRDGKFIVHDDDFDIGMLIDKKEDVNIIYDKISLLLKNQRYKARLVNTYATKIEVYDEAYNKYILPGNGYNGADYYYVTLDIQFYLDKSDRYECLYYIRPSIFSVDKNIILPTGRIKLEGEEFNCPNNSEQFLLANYGSINQNARYNQVTGFYEDLE